MNDISRHEKISPTAWATAHARTFTDIPYSQEVFDWLERKRQEVGQSDLSVKMRETSIALLIEGRYKMIDRYIAQTGSKQILELASGLTQRGFIMTSDPAATYVELDLPTIMGEKRELVSHLEVKHPPARPNLFLESGTALSLGDMQRAASHFKRQPITIVCEGLLRYLSFEEKTIVAKNIHALLAEFGGVWITPDVSLKRHVVRKDQGERRKFNAQVEKTTGVVIERNLFRDKEHAVQFFTDLGFDVDPRPYSEVTADLVCPSKIGITQEEIDDAGKNAVLLVMRARN